MAYFDDGIALSCLYMAHNDEGIELVRPDGIASPTLWVRNDPANKVSWFWD
jgi:hypothetical protein